MTRAPINDRQKKVAPAKLTVPIESDVPVPETRQMKGPEMAQIKGPKKAIMYYPFHKMDIGDSFLAPINKAASARSLCRIYGRDFGAKFVTSFCADGLRVWRIA